MAKKKGSKKAKRQERNASNGRGFSVTGPPVTSQSYSGPIAVPKERHGRDTILRLISSTATVGLDGTGSYTTVFTTDPNAVGNGISTIFTAFAAEYDQYRVLGFEEHYHPINQYNQTISVANAASIIPGFVVQDYDDTIALTSYANAAQYADAVYVNLAKPWKVIWKAATLPLMEFCTTAGSPTEVGAIKHFFSGGTTGVTVGRVWLRYLIQFKATI